MTSGNHFAEPGVKEIPGGRVKVKDFPGVQKSGYPAVEKTKRNCLCNPALIS